MAVYTTGGGGGFLGGLGKIASLAGMFIPGAQPWAAAIGAASALANGDPVGALVNGAGLAKGMGGGAGKGAAVAPAPATSAPPITATGNPAGGVSGVANAGVATSGGPASIGPTLARIINEPTVLDMYSNPAERAYYRNRRWR